jgi:hypothetical protein
MAVRSACFAAADTLGHQLRLRSLRAVRLLTASQANRLRRLVRYCAAPLVFPTVALSALCYYFITARSPSALTLRQPLRLRSVRPSGGSAPALACPSRRNISKGGEW